MRDIANETTDWLQETFIFLPNWKWIALVVATVAGFLILSLARHLIYHLKQKITSQKKFPNLILHFFRKDIQAASSWLVVCFFWYMSFQALSLPESLLKFLMILIHVVSIIQLMRLAYAGVEAVGETLEDFVKTTENTLDDQLAPFATKVLKIFVITMGVLLSLQSFGFNVGAILAGLGIGSLAFALAAQDTAANLFGSITVILDRPFQRGDWIKVGDTEGIVEEVGFRSTRIRTLYKSLVTIPNSTMAKEKIDNMGARPSRRIRHLVGITYDTPFEKMQSFMDRIRYGLSQHPQIQKEELTVVFHSMGDFDLKILVNCFVFVTDIETELKIQQEVLFDVMKAGKETGVEFAFPTQTLHVASLPLK